LSLQVLLHDANEQPLMRERAFKVSPGFLTQVAVTALYVNSLRVFLSYLSVDMTTARIHCRWSTFGYSQVVRSATRGTTV